MTGAELREDEAPRRLHPLMGPQADDTQAGSCRLAMPLPVACGLSASMRLTAKALIGWHHLRVCSGRAIIGALTPVPVLGHA